MISLNSISDNDQDCEDGLEVVHLRDSGVARVSDPIYKQESKKRLREAYNREDCLAKCLVTDVKDKWLMDRWRWCRFSQCIYRKKSLKRR